MSPAEVSVPLTVKSLQMIEGAVPRVGRRAAAGAAVLLRGLGAGAKSLGLLENMMACLKKVIRVAHDVVEPDFIVNMGAGAAAGGTDASHAGAFGDLHAGPY